MSGYKLFHSLEAALDTTKKKLSTLHQTIRRGDDRPDAWSSHHLIFLQHAAGILQEKRLCRIYLEVCYEMLHRYFGFEDAWHLSRHFLVVDETDDQSLRGGAYAAGPEARTDGKRGPHEVMAKWEVGRQQRKTEDERQGASSSLLTDGGDG
ncbi:MAG: hypothetical protein Q9187_000246 [Circinaria calcarea]